MVVIWLRLLCDTHPTLLSGRRFIAMCDTTIRSSPLSTIADPTIHKLLSSLASFTTCHANSDSTFDLNTSHQKKTLQLMHSAANA